LLIINTLTHQAVFAILFHKLDLLLLLVLVPAAAVCADWPSALLLVLHLTPDARSAAAYAPETGVAVHAPEDKQSHRQDEQIINFSLSLTAFRPPGGLLAKLAAGLIMLAGWSEFAKR
jgi:hypothetical protein